MTRSEGAGWKALAVTGALALAYRLVYQGELSARPEFLQPVLDGAAHEEWARGLLDGTWPPREAFFRAPGYVVWLAGLLAAAGDAAAAARVQVVVGAVTAVLTAALAGRLFGRRAAWIGGVGAAVYPTTAFFDGQFLEPVLAVPLTAAGTLLTLGALERGGARRIAGAGLVWSVAAVVRPTLLPAGLLLPVGLLAWRPGPAVPAGRSSGEGRFRARDAVVALVAAMSLPLVVTARNAAVGDPVFLASQGGLNFYIGNGAHADGMSATFPDRPDALGYRMIEEAERIAEREAGRTLGSAEVSSYWTRRALDDIAADPGRWAALLAKKTFLFWGAREIPNNHDSVMFAEFLPVLRWTPGWATWAALGILGLWIGRVRRDVRFAGAVVATILAGCVLFFVNDRFRVPAAPILIALGAGAACEALEQTRAGRRRAAVGVVAAFVALTTLMRWNPWGIPAEPWPVSYVLMAEAEAARGEPVRALLWIERVLEREPGFYAARIAQIDLLRRAGRIEEARVVAERGVQLLPADAALRSELASLLDLGGDPAAALAQVEEALRLDPAFAPARVNRAIILARLGRAEPAVAALRELLAEDPGSTEAARAREALRGIESGKVGVAPH
ncbi:MAG: tetratricopeptide repeat protein [Candidatus Eiseniibacteriota bacterium]